MSYSFAFKVEQQPTKGMNTTIETCRNNTRKDAYMALLRAMAGNPGMFFDLKDEETRDFIDTKTGMKYTIQAHEIRL